MATDSARIPRIAYVGLGSNLGDRASNISKSLGLLVRGGASTAVAVRRVSSVYCTAPVGPVRAQPDFFNAVAEVWTTLEPRRLLWRCLKVELAMGRRREVPKGPRNIDLDLLLMDDTVATWPELTLPHGELLQRAFVLAPLLELSPRMTDPRSGRPLARQLEVLRLQRVQSLGALEPLVAAERGAMTARWAQA